MLPLVLATCLTAVASADPFRLVLLASSEFAYEGNYAQLQIDKYGASELQPPYNPKRFTNRRTMPQFAAQLLSQKEGIDAVTFGKYAHAAASARGPTDVCNGFAQAVVGAPEPVCVKLPGLNDMVDTYLRDVGGKVPEKDVLWLAIGGNDIFAAASDPSVIPKLISDVVGAHVRAVGKLATSGARVVFVTNLGILTFMPLTIFPPEAKLGLEQVVPAYNRAFAAAMKQLQMAFPETVIEIFDGGKATSRALAQASSNGVDIVNPCIDVTKYFPFYFSPQGGFVDPLPPKDEVVDALGCHPEQHFWIDAIHPTHVGHRLLARFTLEQVKRTISRVYGL